MGIIEAASLVASIAVICWGLGMCAFIVKDEIKKLHSELKYMNGKTNRLIQLAQVSIEPVDLVKGEPIVINEISEAEWQEVWNILGLVKEEART